jgi:hypothetical protein
MITETLIGTHKVKVQSQRARVMLFGESPHRYRKIGSSGSNLACEGLLLGMRAGGHGDPQARASPSEVIHSEPSPSDDVCDAPSHILQGKSATRRSFGLVEVMAEPDQTKDPRREGRSRRRSPPHERPQGDDGWR